MAKITDTQTEHLTQLMNIADSTLEKAKNAREDVIDYLNRIITPKPEREDYEALGWLENECE